MSLRTHFVNQVMLRKRHLIAKEDHPFCKLLDKSTLSYEKELPNKQVVAKVFVYVPVKFEADLFLY